MSADALAPVEGAHAGTALDADARPHRDAHAGERGASGDREAAWARALADMEAAADRAEHLLAAAGWADAGAAAHAADAAVTAPWRTPRGLGSLPLALAPRAAALVDRQRDLVRRTAEQLDDHRRALRTADGLRTRAAAAPVYLDVEG
ncbi:hypothetical protein [Cellulomonas pakistanensis]|uniref:Uncharacterized protein n=1 Tax=Cellulomonas pakistanensis TaxID=992287 RepID=A0A919U5Y7_9CELL|nr:hypothetical protein [Cellulomonas pakistanensis]GIG35487.1 hypothetical protein Cpa01nite_08680 [Cellulomonas pakistanensis]